VYAARAAGKTPGVPFTLMLNLPRDGEHVSTLRDVVGIALDGHDAPTDTIDDLQIAIAEAAGNVIRHAEGTDDYSVEVVISDGSCAISVVDAGPGIGPEGAGELTERILAEGGRGVMIMRALTDELHFEQDGETKVRFVKNW
jgi:serine/threonine-protein kinase RsbW